MASEPSKDTRQVTQDEKAQKPPLQSPQAFYAKVVKRADIRKILDRLAK